MRISRQAVALPEFSTGALSALKWLALAWMTVDHVDAFFYGRELGTWVGRLVFPLFGFVIAYNLARPTVGAAARARLLWRLLAFAILAVPFHAPLAAVLGGWWPLNIMATFAAAVAIVDLLDRGQRELAALVFLVAGALVEYWWPGLLWILAVWWCYRERSPSSCVLVLGSIASLALVNGSHWALLTLPLLAIASTWSLELPRLRWAFYAYYPLHLAAFWILGAPGVGAGA